MADERIYVIPLRKQWVKTCRVHRAPRSVNVVKEFIMKHMHTEEVSVSAGVNSAIWAHGAKKPPGKIKVKATKDGSFVRVTLPDEKTEKKEKKAETKGALDKAKAMLPGIRAETKAKPAEAKKKEAKPEENAAQKTEAEKKSEEKKVTAERKLPRKGA